MKFKFFIFIGFVFYSFALRTPKPEHEISFAKNQVECRKLEKNKLHPLDCCVYPRFCDANSTLLNSCAEFCRSMPYPHHRCQRNCIITSNGWINQMNQFNSSAILKSFFEGGNDELKPLSADWTSIVSDGAKKCEVEAPKVIPNDEVLSNQFLNYYYEKFVECVRIFNFVNCPEKLMKKSEECENLQKTMAKCNTSNYDLTHEVLFEDFYYREKENKSAKIKSSSEN